MLTEASESWNPSTREWRLPYRSLNETALALEGSWRLEVEDPFGFPPGQPTTEAFEFRLEDLLGAEIDRSPPTNINLSDPALIPNGNEFLISWDYTDATERGTLLQLIPMFDDGLSIQRSVLSTPTPGSTRTGSGSTGVDDRMLSRSLRNEPGATTPRWLFTLTASEAALPLDIEMTLGSPTSLQDRVWTRGRVSDSFLASELKVTLDYLRVGERLTIRLIVPEPANGVLLGSMLVPMVTRCRDRRARSS